MKEVLDLLGRTGWRRRRKPKQNVSDSGEDSGEQDEHGEAGVIIKSTVVKRRTMRVGKRSMMLKSKVIWKGEIVDKKRATRVKGGIFLETYTLP